MVELQGFIVAQPMDYMNKTNHVYVSAMETIEDGIAKMDNKALGLIDGLAGKGYRVYWNKQWRPYGEILADIAISNVMLAIVDRTWASSSWMAAEAMWSLGEAAVEVEGTPPTIAAIPLFVYPLCDPSDWGLLRGRSDIIVLNTNIDSAIDVIHSTLTTIIQS